MAETLISPGVLARENDSSQITSQPVEFGAALITPAVLGPVQIPTLVTSFSEYEAIFGSTLSSGSGVYSYLGSVAANNYFSQGGTSLLVSRVVNDNNGTGSFTQASSTRIQNNVSSGQLKFIDSGSASDPTGVTRGSEPNAATNPSASGFSYSIAFGAPGATGSTAGTSYLVPATSSLAGTGAEVAPKEALLIVIVSPATYPDPGFVTANDANDAVPVTPEANVMATSAPVPAKLLVAGTK